MCLHPAPSSGLYFETVMPLLAENHTVICPDYPGYGGSSSPSSPPLISDYANAMLQFLEAISVEGPIDIFGFHSGCLVGSEIALKAPAKTGKLILCDIPYFDAARRTEFMQTSANPLALTEDLQCLGAAWKFNVTNRLGDASLDRGLDLFAEQLRSGTNDHYAFHAAFSYDCEKRLAALNSNVSIIATKSGLRSATIAAADNIPNARLIDAADITGKVFESNASLIATYILDCLSDHHE